MCKYGNIEHYRLKILKYSETMSWHLGVCFAKTTRDD